MADSPCPTCSPNSPTCGDSASCDIRGDLLTNSCVCGTNLRPANVDQGYRVFVELANEYIIIVAEGVDCDTSCTFDQADDRCAEVPEVPGECRDIPSTVTTASSSTSSSSVSTSTETPVTSMTSSISSSSSSLPTPTILPTSMSTSQTRITTSSTSSLPITPTTSSTSQVISSTAPSSGFSIFSVSDDPQSTTKPTSSGGPTSQDPDDQSSLIVLSTTQQTLSGSILPIPFSSDTALVTSGSATIKSSEGTQSGSILPLTDASVPLPTDNSRQTSQATYLPASASNFVASSSPELSSSPLGSIALLLPSSNGANRQSVDGLSWATSVSAAQEPGQRLSYDEQGIGGHEQGLSDQDQRLSAGSAEIDPWDSNNEGAQLGGLVLTAGEGQQGPSWSAGVKATGLEIVVEASAASSSVNLIPFVLLLVHIFRLQ